MLLAVLLLTACDALAGNAGASGLPAPGAPLLARLLEVRAPPGAAASLFRSWSRLARHFAASRASLRRRVSAQAEEAQLRKLEAALEDELRRVKVEEALLQQQLQRVAPERPQGAPR